jgi:hypothetical protein
VKSVLEVVRLFVQVFVGVYSQKYRQRKDGSIKESCEVIKTNGSQVWNSNGSVNRCIVESCELYHCVNRYR